MQSLSLSQLTRKLQEYEYFIIDRAVYNDHLKECLKWKKIFFLDDPEKCKSLECFEKACHYFIDSGMKRRSTLVCIGGGATTDLGGFVASTLYRGVPWIPVPTTLLAMIDASIGGKVGINTRHGKNLIGSFHSPEYELLSLDFLESLNNNQIESGKGELLKYAFLSSDINSMLESNIDYKEAIGECIKFKKNIVLQDFKERGLREILNYGHTFGHAFEKLSGIEHGIAVAIGIKLNIELFAKELIPHFEKMINILKLSLCHPKVNFDDFLEVLKFDKKNKSQKLIRFVIVDPIAKTRLIDFELKELRSLIMDSKNYDHYFK